MEIDNAIFPQISKHPVNRDKGETCRIVDMFLGERKMHLLDLAAGPLRAVTDEQFQQEMGYALTRRVTPDAGEAIERQVCLIGAEGGQDIALQRNQERSTDKIVPEASVKSVAANFWPPSLDEGFCKITIIGS